MKSLSVLFIFSIVLFIQSAAQDSDQGIPHDPIVKQAIAQLNFALQPPEGDIYKFASENTITGTFTFDITIRKKGETATVFVISSENASIHMQIQLKDYLNAFRYDLTVP